MNQTDEWIVGYLSGNLSPTETEKFRLWLEASAENRRYFTSIQEIWVAMPNSQDYLRFDKHNAYLQFAKRVKTTAKHHRIIPPAWKWLYAAAMIAVIVVCSWAAFRQGRQSVQQQLAEIRIEVPVNATTRMHLPDGTQVWLNAGSVLVYPQSFGIENRQIDLVGEGYFEVAPDHTHPFNVHTDGLDVQVLGTKFNLRNYADESTAKVALLEGRVAVKTMTKSRILQPNHEAVLNKQGDALLVTATDASNAAGWTDGRLYFSDVPLSDITCELARSYGVSITIDDAALDTIHFFGVFHKDRQGVEDILDALSSTGKIKYKKNNEKEIVITLPQ